jgi:hypothetical protein
MSQDKAARALAFTSVEDARASLQCAELNGGLDQMEPTIKAALALAVRQKTKAALFRRFLKKIERNRKAVPA